MIKKMANHFTVEVIANIVEVIVENKDEVIRKLKERGCRITRQRLILIDIIMEEKCQSCKEIYFKASNSDNKIGLATVYRMVSVLEEMGVVNRR